MKQTPPPNSRVLMELRTCFEGFAGIPQETRLLFSSFLDLPNLKVDGLINHTGRRLGAAPRSIAGLRHDKKFDQLSKFVVSTLPSAPSNVFSKARLSVATGLAPLGLTLRTGTGRSLRLDEFEASAFVEFIWDTLFSATLPPGEIGKVRDAAYRTLTPSWRSMHRSGLLAAYPTIDTRGYDFFLAQTPYPARMARGTRLVVRYHDAIPIFQPQTIPSTRFHRKSHYFALRDNAEHGVFVCTSEATRQELLKLFPQLEKRSPVIHDIVSHNYFVDRGSRAAAAEVIRSRINPETEPKLQIRHRDAFYSKNLNGEDLRYLLMVSSIEPRKNHIRLLRAWEQLRATGHPDLRLVIVGTLGWDYSKMVNAFKPWQERGLLFHLSDVPSSDLRKLYGQAEAVVCPSIAEGFDLSGIEAMLCGAAVAASDIPVHREVYGNSAVYFDRYSVGGAAEAIGRLLGSAGAGLRQQMQERGVVHAAQYSRGAIAPQWSEFFGRLRMGEYAA